MSAALWLLIRLHVRALARRALRGVRTFRGLLFVLVAVGFVALFFTAQLSARKEMLARRSTPVLVDSTAGASFGRFGPVGLFAFTLLAVFSSSRHRGVRFSASEVDVLFAAPFSRRELLVYRVAYQALQNAVGVLLMCIFLSPYFHDFFRAYIALFLTFTFLGLAQQFVSLVAGAIEERFLRLGRTVLAVVLVMVAVAVLSLTFAATGGGQTALERMSAILDLPVTRAALFPFRVFSEMLGASTLPSFLAWGSGALAFVIALFTMVVVLDVDYREAAVETSRKLHEKLGKLRSGRVTATGSKKLRLSVPELPHLGGVGTMAWRQVQELVRESPTALYLFVVFGVGALIPLLAMSSTSDDSVGGTVAMALLPITVACPLVLSNWFQFDFRGDVDRMQQLLVLPISPRATALGQVITPTLVISLVQGAAFLVILRSAATQTQAIIALSGLILTVPVNFLFICIENAFFLVAPARVSAGTPGDFQNLGRFLFSMFMKFLLLAVLAAVGAVFGGVAHSATGSIGVAIAIVFVYVLAIDAIALRVVAYAYERFDITRIPPE